MAAHICYYSTPLRRHLLDSYSSSTISSPYAQLGLYAPNHLSPHSLRRSNYNNPKNLTDAKKIVPIERQRQRNLTMNCQSTMEQKPISQDRMLVFVPPHPLIKHWVSVLRNEETPSPIFKNAMAELGRLLMYEASRDWLPTITGEIRSPMGVAAVEFIDPREPVAIVPILRAGLALAEHASSILPATKTYHLGVSRDEETLQPTIYLNKLPDKFPDGSRVLVVDPMLATGMGLLCMKSKPGRPASEKVLNLSYEYTKAVGILAAMYSSPLISLMPRIILAIVSGGTIVAAINLIKERGVENKQIKVVSAVAAPPALQKLSENFPGLHVYSGIIDPTVNEKGFIIPGLGDAGDRSFGT